MTSVAAEPASASAVAGGAYQEYLLELLANGILVRTGVQGVYGKGRVFEQVLTGFDRHVSDSGLDQAPEILRFPPVINRRDFERSDYLKSFPHLAGTVHSFAGNDREHADLLSRLERDEDWTAHYHATDLVLTPAACYPVYPAAAGILPPGGRVFDVQSFCFRHEPSDDPARMQIFRMHEYVRIGSAQQVRDFRDLWLDRSHTVLRSVGLAPETVVANDPFFGRGGAMLAANQRDQALKFELVVPICSSEIPTAVVSCNYHQDHFGEAFGIATSDGGVAHTACVGFGLERIALALFKAHGLNPGAWPTPVRTILGL